MHPTREMFSWSLLRGKCARDVIPMKLTNDLFGLLLFPARPNVRFGRLVSAVEVFFYDAMLRGVEM